MLTLLLFFTIIFQTPTLHDNRNELSDEIPYLRADYDLLDTRDTVISFQKISTDTTLKYYRLEDNAKLAIPGKNYWLRFRIKNNSNQSYVIMGLRTFEGNLYIPNTSGAFEKIKINKKTYFWKRIFFSNDFIVMIPYSKKELY